MLSPRKSDLFLILCLLAPLFSAAADSTRTLSKDAFLSIVRLHHPTLKAAGLQVRRAQAEVLQARGAFDPRADVDFAQKEFGGKPYYSYFNPEVVIPTWYGVELKAGYEDITGQRVNPEATLGQNSYLGVKVPVTSLLFDRRRATLQQALRTRQMTEAEQQLTINDLLFEAMTTYWNWVKEFRILTIMNNAVRVNEERLRFVRVEFEQGSRPAIDTTETLAQLQSFYLQQNAAELAFRNAGLELSNFLWLDGAPVLLTGNILPDTLALDDTSNNIPALARLLASVNEEHPKLRMLRNKTSILEIERRLKAQYLLPKVGISANYLNKGYTAPAEVSAYLLENNYKVGIDVSVPVLLREARGAYQAAKLKIGAINLETAQTTLELENKVKAYYNELNNNSKQVRIYEDVFTNTQRLFNGERFRFENGESTLFLLNSRENKQLEAGQKLVELKFKRLKSYAGTLWAAGVLR